MTTTPEFIGSTPWWRTTAGLQLLAWERQWFDAGVADVFGFHALQLGLPAVDALKSNRMPHRWLACAAQGMAADGDPGEPGHVLSVHLQCEFDALPFANQSLDLVVMPHALEMAHDPHLTLREVERVLVPEGRLMITAFNPASLWAVRPRQRLDGGLEGAGRPLGLWPRRAEMIGFRRLRDWLRLLSFEVEAARFGCFGPRVDTLAWQQRWSFIEPVGQRWWPVLGAVYGLTAVKRVRGMRLVGLAKRQARYASAPRPALVSTHQERSHRGSQRS